MAPLALALHLAVASPGLAPSLDPGPFQGSELVGSSLGVMAGDMLVLASGYLTLQLFASEAIYPSADNFRRAAYVLGVTALLVPPATAVLLARWLRAEPASGAAWKALLLAATGQLAALTAGFLASPHFWVVLPVQLVMVGAGTSLGLHWGPRTRHRAPAPPTERERLAAPAADAAALAPMICPDPALAPPRRAAG